MATPTQPVHVFRAKSRTTTTVERELELLVYTGDPGVPTPQSPGPRRALPRPCHLRLVEAEGEDVTQARSA